MSPYQERLETARVEFVRAWEDCKDSDKASVERYERALKALKDAIRGNDLENF